MWTHYAGTLVLTGGGQEFDLADTGPLDRAALAARVLPDAPVAVLAPESPSGMQAEAVARHLRQLGADSVTTVPLHRRQDSADASVLDSLRRAGLLYVASTDPYRLVEVLRDTPALEAIEAAGREGAVLVLAGDSAAAAGTAFGTPLWEPGVGLGLLPQTVIVPHCTEHLRFYNLMWWAVKELTWVCLGIDERTGLVLRPGRAPRVIGDRNVYLLDPRPAAGHRLGEFPQLRARGLALHIATAGEDLVW